MDLRIIHWAAHITGTLLLAFLIVMLIGHLVGDANGPEGIRFSSNTERLAFAFFPCCTILGLVLAYKWQVVGGLIVLVSIGMLFVLLPGLEQVRFLLMMLPGILHLGRGQLLRRRGHRRAKRPGA